MDLLSKKYAQTKEIEKLKQDIEAYKQSEQEAREIIAELKAENERLKEELQKFKDMAKKGLDEFKDVGGCWGCGLQLQLNQDMEDIKRLKVQKDKYYQQTLDDEIKLNELYQTLQEIKAIADAPKPFIDFSVIKTATEVGYDYATICNELELRLHKVLELITKAEEE